MVWPAGKNPAASVASRDEPATEVQLPGTHCDAPQYPSSVNRLGLDGLVQETVSGLADGMVDPAAGAVMVAAAGTTALPAAVFTPSVTENVTAWPAAGRTNELVL